MGGAHRQFCGLQGVANEQGLEALELQLPAKRCQATRSQGSALLADHQALEMTDVLPQQVGARSPTGQGHAQPMTAGAATQLSLDPMAERLAQIKMKLWHGEAQAVSTTSADCRAGS